MWLKPLNCIDRFNVKIETDMSEEEKKSKRNPLELFRKLTTLRQTTHAIHDGNIFYPWQDREIFSFLR